MVFRDLSEAQLALNAKEVSLHAKIRARVRIVKDGKSQIALVNTTPGRLLLTEVVPDSNLLGFELVNKLLTKKEITNVIDQVYRHCGQKETVIFCDRLMGLGFHRHSRPAFPSARTI